MTIATVRRLAADILNVGERRIWINPYEVEEVKKMATRADVRDLIDKGTVKKMPVAGRKKVGKKVRRNKGSRKGSTDKKEKKLWMQKVRAQRRLLASMMKEGALPPEEKRRIYSRIKSGLFRNKKAMLAYLKEGKLIAADYEEKRPKPEKKKKAPKMKKSEKKKAKSAPKKKEGESK
ncbi:TPA: hypothetical protein EYP38_00480 [Candidatus Micrarchaeota archaeon]|nr:hypothetical protein [Candidatus Micrarchaeota archaeon]